MFIKDFIERRISRIIWSLHMSVCLFYSAAWALPGHRAAQRTKTGVHFALGESLLFPDIADIVSPSWELLYIYQLYPLIPQTDFKNLKFL